LSSKIIKWSAITIGGLIAILSLLVLGLLAYGQLSFKRTHDRPIYPITADMSPAGIARGEYLVRNVMACGDCHAPMQGGNLDPDGLLIGCYEEFNDGPFSGIFATPNMTPDLQTGLGSWTDAEIARAIREGIDKDGVELVVMPSNQYNTLSDADVAAIVGYLRSLEPVYNEIPEFSGNLLAKTALALGVFGPRTLGEPIASARLAPEPGTIAYGAYLVQQGSCRDCHGEDLAGGQQRFIEGIVPNLTPAGNLATWSANDFITSLRTGITPDGRTLDVVMPWKVYSKMTDEDLTSIYQYLASLPGIEMSE
jgi:mono/diheme cytochrome c family protein